MCHALAKLSIIIQTSRFTGVTLKEHARAKEKQEMCSKGRCALGFCATVCVFRGVSICETSCKIRNNCRKSLWKAHNTQQGIRSSHEVSERDVPECISQVAVAALG